MKTRLLIIIGIIMMTTIPLATIAVLERYDNYLEQLEYEIQRIDNEPKLGERSYIEPKLKAKLEGIELDLREKVKQLHQGIPSSSYAVNLDHQTKEIVVLVENKNLISKINEMTTQYPNDVLIVIINEKITLDEFLQDNVEPEYERDPEKMVTGSYELENPLCIGGRGMIVNEDCERIGKYDVSTGLLIVENKEQCDMLEGDWNEQQHICDSKYSIGIENEN